jgi:hypothetical protein
MTTTTDAERLRRALRPGHVHTNDLHEQALNLLDSIDYCDVDLALRALAERPDAFPVSASISRLAARMRDDDAAFDIADANFARRRP